MKNGWYRIKDKEGFECGVYGADCLLKYYPQLCGSGVYLIRIGEYMYISLDMVFPVNDSSFFSKEEMQYLIEI